MKLLPMASAIVLVAGGALAQTPAATLFENVMVFDGTSAELTGPSNVLVEGNRITRITDAPIAVDTATTTIAGDEVVEAEVAVDRLDGGRAHQHGVPMGVDQTGHQSPAVAGDGRGRRVHCDRRVGDARDPVALDKDVARPGQLGRGAVEDHDVHDERCRGGLGERAAGNEDDRAGHGQQIHRQVLPIVLSGGQGPCHACQPSR